MKMLAMAFWVLTMGLGNTVLSADPGVLEEILVESACEGKHDRIDRLLSLNIPIDIDVKDGTGANALICAVSRNHLKTAQVLLSHGADPDVADRMGDIVLNVSIRQGNAAMVKTLLQNGADPNRIDSKGFPPIFYAACLGHADMVISLIENRADVNARDMIRGETALIRTITHFRSSHPSHLPVSTIGISRLPCSSDQVKMIKLLLENGADVHARAKNSGNTALHFAATRNDADVVSLLVGYHADPDAVNKNGETPLYVAVLAGMPQSVDALLERSADPDAKNKAGSTPLLAVIRASSTSATYMKAMDQIGKRLIIGGASLSFRDKYARTYLMLAAESGKASILKLLLAESKHFIDAKDGQGLTALMYAARSNHHEAARALVNAGAKVYPRDSMGKTALLYAANSRDITRLLLDKGARINDRDRKGYTPLMQAVEYGNLAVICELILRRADVNAVDNKMHQSPLMLAVAKRNLPIVSKLLKSGADVHLKDCTGQAAIHIAAQRGQSQMISLLLDNKSAVDSKTSGGKTPLHVASENGYVDSVELLLRRGAPINATDNAGWSPLSYAVFNGHYDVCRLLVGKGADTKIKDNRDRSLKELAEEQGFSEILTLL